MFPYRTRRQWLLGDRVSDTAAIAGLAEPHLDADDRAVLAARTQAFTRWSLVRAILMAILLIGTVTAATGGILAALALASAAGLVTAVAASLAGLASLAYALVTRHVNRLEADLWGVLTLAALRRTGQPSTGHPKSPPR